MEDENKKDDIAKAMTVDRDVVDFIKQEILTDLAKSQEDKTDEGNKADEGDKTPQPAPQPEPNPEVKNVFETKNPTFGTDRTIKSFQTGNFATDFKRQLTTLNLGKADMVADFNGINLEAIAKFENNLDYVQEKYGVSGRYLTAKAFNTGTADGEDGSGGAVLIPPPEALIGIERYESDYGMAFTEANVRTTNNREIYAINGEDNVELYRLGEGEAKSESNPSYGRISTTLTKAASIAFATDELISDDVHGFVNDLLKGFARARGKLADELVYTDDGNNATDNYGLLELAGTTSASVGSAIGDLSWDTILSAYWNTLSAGRANIKLHVHRSVWGALTASRNGDGNYDWNPTLATTTPFGIPAVLPEILPAVPEIGSNEKFGIMGDFSRVDLIVNGGLVIQSSNTAVRGSTNAWVQDLTSFRAVTRMAKLVRKPEAFTVLKTGAVVS